MKKLFRFLALGLAALPLGLTGCGRDGQFPAYSSAVKYGVREDPFVVGATADLGDERYDPDRPGIFPIMKYDDILKEDSPYHPKLEQIKQKRVLFDPLKIAPALRQQLEAELEKIFGTPARPKVDLKAAALDPAVETKALPIEDSWGTVLKLEDGILDQGMRLYRVNCLHCHGVPGNGRGPTARWINPHPRDFRAGLFKFQSVDKAIDGRAHPPSRGDLMRTLRQGIEGTAMPSFALLSDDQLEALISYVTHLSLRGQVELKIMKNERMKFNDTSHQYDAWLEVDEDGTTLKFSEAVKQELSLALKEKKREGGYIGWVPSQDPANWITPEPYPYPPNDLAALKASVKRGQMLFTASPSKEFLEEYRDRLIKQEIKNPAELTEAKKLEFLKRAESTAKIGCISCHVDFGRQAKFRYDLWGTLVRPNNFTLGVFRGGHRPVDLYYRIHSGINGSEMTPFGKNFQGQDIWDLVNFVSNLSYPNMRRELGVHID